MKKKDTQAESGTLAVAPGGTYNSTRYPPDRNYPRKKTKLKGNILKELN